MTSSVLGTVVADMCYACARAEVKHLSPLVGNSGAIVVLTRGRCGSSRARHWNSANRGDHEASFDYRSLATNRPNKLRERSSSQRGVFELRQSQRPQQTDRQQSSTTSTTEEFHHSPR
ncbi:hypothetical protein J6590_004791 [Homalodisca vitripennis]|nr:hypothetical protein J6590_004791 [Homalodisca vitripennis]